MSPAQVFLVNFAKFLRTVFHKKPANGSLENHVNERMEVMYDLHKLILSKNKMLIQMAIRDMHWWKEGVLNFI